MLPATGYLPLRHAIKYSGGKVDLHYQYSLHFLGKQDRRFTLQSY